MGSGGRLWTPIGPAIWTYRYRPYADGGMGANKKPTSSGDPAEYDFDTAGQLAVSRRPLDKASGPCSGWWDTAPRGGAAAGEIKENIGAALPPRAASAHRSHCPQSRVSATIFSCLPWNGSQMQSADLRTGSNTNR